MKPFAKINNICTGNIAPGRRTDFASSVGTKTSNNTSKSRFKKQLLLYYYETHLQVTKALLNNLLSKAAKIRQKKNSSGHKQVISFFIWTYKERKVLE